jgi:hypothetical protein
MNKMFPAVSLKNWKKYIVYGEPDILNVIINYSNTLIPLPGNITDNRCDIAYLEPNNQEFPMMTLVTMFGVLSGYRVRTPKSGIDLLAGAILAKTYGHGMMLPLDAFFRGYFRQCGLNSKQVDEILQTATSCFTSKSTFSDFCKSAPMPYEFTAFIRNPAKYWESPNRNDIITKLFLIIE